MDRGSECYARFLAGEPEGLTALIEEYRDGLILYLCSIVGDYGAAEELAEDTFVKLLLKRPKDRGTGAFKTWLYTIGRHLALDRMRKQKREVSVPPEAPAGSTRGRIERRSMPVCSRNLSIMP